MGDDHVPEPLRGAMISVLLPEEVEQQGVTGQINPQLRKHKYPEAEHAFRKRNRRDVREQAAVQSTAGGGKAANQHHLQSS